MRGQRNSALTRIVSIDPDTRRIARYHGMGVLVTPEHVVTCAHVIAEMLRAQSASAKGVVATQPSAPSDSVYLDFPVIAPNEVVVATITFWSPDRVRGEPYSRTADLAVLRLDCARPSDQVGPLTTAEPRGQRFIVLGAPKEVDRLSTNAQGSVLDAVAAGLLELDISAYEDEPENRVRAGFSGGGIWVEGLGGFVGIVKQVRDDDTRALAIPARSCISAIEKLDPDAFVDRDCTSGPVLYLLDRRDESRRVAEALMRSENPERVSPLLLFVEGGADDGHYAFVERFRGLKRCAFPRTGIPASTLADIIPIEWRSTPNDGLAALCTRVLNYVQPGGTATESVQENAALLGGALRSYGEPTGFELHLTISDFPDDDRNLLERWIELWQAIAAAGLAKVAVVFMCVRFDARAERGRIAFHNFLHQANSPISHRIALSQVEIEDVESWLNGAVRRFRPEYASKIPVLITRARRRFNDEAKNMDEILSWDEYLEFT